MNNTLLLVCLIQYKGYIYIFKVFIGPTDIKKGFIVY